MLLIFFELRLVETKLLYLDQFSSYWILNDVIIYSRSYAFTLDLPGRTKLFLLTLYFLDLKN